MQMDRLRVMFSRSSGSSWLSPAKRKADDALKNLLHVLIRAASFMFNAVTAPLYVITESLGWMNGVVTEKMDLETVA